MFTLTYINVLGATTMTDTKAYSIRAYDADDILVGAYHPSRTAAYSSVYELARLASGNNPDLFYDVLVNGDLVAAFVKGQRCDDGAYGRAQRGEE